MKSLLCIAIVCGLLHLQALALDDTVQAQKAIQENSQQAQPSSSATPSTAPLTTLKGFGLEDGTPVKLRLSRNLSSASDKKGDTVDFEVLEDVVVNEITVIPRGGVAWATITEAEPKRRMGRGGKLDVNIDTVRLNDGEKVPLRAVRENKGGGHVGAMTGAMVATGIIFFPAAPLFLFMHGKDINIPKGTEITAYITGNIPLDKAKFQGGELSSTVTSPAGAGSTTSVAISSSPAGADVEVDGKFVGNTPSTIPLVAGEHSIKITKKGYKLWERKLNVSGGATNLSAELDQQ
ncbi:MAG TPA: PEGA domain-containing protein [Candidatus Angelobacter sp.]|nr:PEGA domain-containing protein [Candidatus Angelobacter sp.]